MASLENLPAELLRLIFAEMSDMCDLHSLAATGRKLYNSILADEKKICQTVLQNQFDSDTLRDLVFACKADQQQKSMGPLERWTNEMRQELLAHYANSDIDAVLECITFSAFIDLMRFYSAVQYVRVALAERALEVSQQQHPSAVVANYDRFPSYTEARRIDRALCRFELFRCLFAKQDPRPPQHQRNIFWALFSPWEIEQIACAFDFFYNRLFEEIEGLATLEPAWTAHVASRGGITEEMIGHLLARGITPLASFLQCCCTDKKRTLKPELFNVPLVYPHFVSDGLGRSMIAQISTAPSLLIYQLVIPLGEMRGEQERQYVRPAFSKDSDSGPEDIWRWSHASTTPTGPYNTDLVRSVRQATLRECGYVFWNRARADCWGNFQKPWKGEFRIWDARSQREYHSRQRIWNLAMSLVKSGTLRWIDEERRVEVVRSSIR